MLLLPKHTASRPTLQSFTPTTPRRLSLFHRKWYTKTKPITQEEPSVAKNTLTHIRAWKVFVFTIISFGIYALVWMVRRYRELDTSKQTPVPHWLWLVSMVSSILIVVFFLSASTVTMENTRQAAEMTVYGGAIAGLLLTIGMTWWSARYLQAIHQSLGTPITTFQLVTMTFFCAPVAVTATQYAINRPLPVRRELQPVFVKAMYASIIVGAFSIIYSYSPPSLRAEVEKTEQSIITVQQDLEALQKQSPSE